MYGSTTDRQSSGVSRTMRNDEALYFLRASAPGRDEPAHLMWASVAGWMSESLTSGADLA